LALYLIVRFNHAADSIALVVIDKVQSQRDYLPLLDTSTNQAKQQTNTLRIGTHILSESSKDNSWLGCCLCRRRKFADKILG
jgi:hypothetical protein